MGRFKGICDGYGVVKENVQVFATEAMRTAKNRDEMLDAIKRESGLTVDILSPAMESLFGAMGARSGFNHVDGLFMDLGGGSVQMTYINSEAEGDYDILAAESAKSELLLFVIGHCLGGDDRIIFGPVSESSENPYYFSYTNSV